MSSLSDVQSVSLCEPLTAQEFTVRILSNVPGSILTLLRIRDHLVRPFGFARMPGNTKDIDLCVGGTAGPFRFLAVDENCVTGGNSDKHIEFTTTFFIDKDEAGLVGKIKTTAHSKSPLGAMYLKMISLGHQAAMRSIFRAAHLC